MSTFFSHSPHKKPLFLLILPIILFACARGDVGSLSSGEDDDLNRSQDSSEAIAVIDLPDAMGFVMNPDGSPVAFALVGSSELTISEGVMAGSPERTESGWIEVEGLGYLTGYTRPYYEFNGTDYFETYLTPVQYGVFLERGGEASISLTPTESYAVTLGLSAAQFSVDPVQVFASPIASLDVEPRYAPNPSGSGYTLQTAFGVMAYDNEGAHISLAPAAHLSIEVDARQAPGEDFLMAWFDPDSGKWIAEGVDCTSSADGMYSCYSDHLSPLFGIFRPSLANQERPFPAVLSEMSPPVGSIVLSDFNFNLLHFFASHLLESAEEGFKSALGDYKDWLANHGGSLDPDDPQARAVLDNLINSARQSAVSNPNDTGISHLAVAAAAAADAGLGDISSQLQSEAADIADELGRNDLNESDCGEYERLLRRAEQIITLKGDPNLADQLTQKAQDMATDCDIWIGRIQVFMRVNHSHPAGLDMSSITGSLWIESHSITMWTNVDDYVMHGEDKITLMFTEVTYNRQSECKQEIKMSGQGGPQNAQIEGRYDGYTFQINSFTPVTSGITIVQYWDINGKESDTCKQILKTQYQFPNYVSVIIHGFEYGSQPLTLQDMLDEGSTTSIITPQDSIYGFEEITNPDTDLGKYPFTSGRVDWTFTHRDKKLPIQEQ